jgi:hypothetical protein
MAPPGCSGPIFLVISLEVVGRDTGSTLAALVPVIYDASTRAPVVMDSPGRGRYQQPMQVSERGQSWRRRRNVRLYGACGGSKQQLGPHRNCNGLAVVWRFSGSGPMAEQRESKLVGEVEVWARALQQRTGLVSTA